MADLKISQLTAATTPLAGTEVLPIVQSSATRKVTVADLTAGRAVTATSFEGALTGTVGATTANTGAFTTLGATGVVTVSAGTAAAPAITTSGDTNTGVFFPAADTIAVVTNGVEATRVDSNRNFMVGTTTKLGDGKLSVLYASDSEAAITTRSTIESFNTAIQFLNTAAVQVGYIGTSTTATVYATSSDYRLKEAVAPMTGALAKIAALKPVTYKWKVDGSNGQGFIAHELQEVVPECVLGEKDAVDSNGNPRYQGIDTSFLMATLTAALQEAVAEINALKARLNAANI